MKKSHKYQKNAHISRNCIDCKNYGGMLSKHYYLCTAEVYEDQKIIANRNIYDIKVMKKGACYLYKPVEVYDVLPNYITMDSDFEEDATDLSDEE